MKASSASVTSCWAERLRVAEASRSLRWRSSSIRNVKAALRRCAVSRRMRAAVATDTSTAGGSGVGATGAERGRPAREPPRPPVPAAAEWRSPHATPHARRAPAARRRAARPCRSNRDPRRRWTARPGWRIPADASRDGPAPCVRAAPTTARRVASARPLSTHHPAAKAGRRRPRHSEAVGGARRGEDGAAEILLQPIRDIVPQ